MNLTWHMVRKDLRGLKWPLLLWTCLIVLKLSVGFLLLRVDGAADYEAFSSLTVLANVLAGMECLSLVLVAVLIQADQLVGTSAFWVTRPIAGTRLLRAKLLSMALVFGLLPLLITLPWWLACGYSLREIGLAATETLVVHLGIVLLGLLWAVITGGLGRFLLWFLVMVVVVLAIGAVGSASQSGFPDHRSVEVRWTRNLVAVAIALGGILAVVVHQFRTRRTMRTIGLLAASAGVFVVNALWWPWSWGLHARWDSFRERQALAAWPLGTEPSGLRFDFEQAELASIDNLRADKQVRLRTGYTVHGLGEDQVLIPSGGDYSLQWPDGFSDRGRGWTRFRAPSYDSGVWRIFGGRLGRDGDAIDAHFSQLLPALIGARLRVEPATYGLTARFALLEIEAKTKVPLRSGAMNRTGSVGERLAHVESDDEEIRITFIRHHSEFIVRELAVAGHYVFGASRERSCLFPQYSLVRPETDTVTMDDQHSARRILKSVRIATVKIISETQFYPSVTDGREHFVSDAEVIKMTFRHAANFAHELKVDQLSTTPLTPVDFNPPAIQLGF